MQNKRPRATSKNNPNNTYSVSIFSWPTIPPQNMSGGSRSSALGGGDPLLPSPASPSAVIVSPETLSHHSSPAKTTRQPGHVQIAPPLR